MFKQKEYNKLADTDYKMEEYVRVPRLGIDNLHKEIIQLQNKLDKIKEYAVDRIAVSDRLYSNQNNLEKVVANYENILLIIESESE